MNNLIRLGLKSILSWIYSDKKQNFFPVHWRIDKDNFENLAEGQKMTFFEAVKLGPLKEKQDNKK